MPVIRFYFIILGIFLLSACTPSNLDKAKQSYAQKDYTEAFNASLKLAKFGDTKAEYAVGYMYFNGLGTLKDEDMGRYWIRRAAASQYAPAEKALDLITAPDV